MEPNRLFRIVPPWPTVADVLKLLNLSTEPPFTFQKEVIQVDNSVEAAALLEPYYIPCKAKLYLAHTNAKRWVTVLRHILTPHGWVIVSQETTRDKKKAIFYSVERCGMADGPLKQAVKIDFS